MHRDAEQARAAASAVPGLIAGLIRLAIFVAILWYITSALLRIPPIRAFKDALVSGDATQVTTAADGVRSWFQALLTNTFGTTGSPGSSGGPGDDAKRASASGDAVPAANPPASNVYDPGNGVTMPQATRRVEPAYTAEAMRRKIQGSVLLTCVVRPDFTVSDIAVVRSLDAKYGLDQEAVKALEQWRFTPGRRNGRFVPVRISVEMTFTLP
jgi:TonB family protein